MVEESELKEFVAELIEQEGTLDLINSTELTGNGSHYVGNHLGYNIWIFAEFNEKFIYIQKNGYPYPISWTLGLHERFTKRDVSTYIEYMCMED